MWFTANIQTPGTDLSQSKHNLLKQYNTRNKRQFFFFQIGFKQI
jgi:hypothetical protein